MSYTTAMGIVLLAGVGTIISYSLYRFWVGNRRARRFTARTHPMPGISQGGHRTPEEQARAAAIAQVTLADLRDRHERERRRYRADVMRYIRRRGARLRGR